ncbi:hypothetical protein K432DRAFT_377372 [Lepidopterella palustris CBS 459.81]|uniref:Uncharacterized protein n=1 Tax=Lepidopterella palustris CBS 459.81 TaxID=1314670 RepID=A0A8E2JKE8_9PEZI|nr:hypothetical protein K432DRAFT_377372 [Lepidopterella palustris CBS 459.81]
MEGDLSDDLSDGNSNTYIDEIVKIRRIPVHNPTIIHPLLIPRSREAFVFNEDTEAESGEENTMDHDNESEAGGGHLEVGISSRQTVASSKSLSSVSSPDCFIPGEEETGKRSWLARLSRSLRAKWHNLASKAISLLGRNMAEVHLKMKISFDQRGTKRPEKTNVGVLADDVWISPNLHDYPSIKLL